MYKKPFLPLKLQMFAEPEGTPEDTQAEGAETEATDAPEIKTFTQDDIDKAIADRIKRENQKSAKQMKELQTKLEAFENANKTDEEKANAELETLKTTASEKEKTIAELSIKFEAVSSGVAKDKLDKFIKLASLSDAEDAAEKVAETLAEFPEFASVAQAPAEEKKPKIVAGGNTNTGTETDEDKLKKILGIK